MRPIRLVLHFLLATWVLSHAAMAQHLWWDTKGLDEATCLYGEITVLATNSNTYYCGANWHPGEPAGGYCGIQHNRGEEKRTICSVWDTSKELHPKVIEADEKTILNRFGGEGEGAHTHRPCDWHLGQTIRFFVRKEKGAEKETTDLLYFVFDVTSNKWIPVATISSPNGDEKSARSVALLGGGLVSFLENFSGKQREVPKLALYRLWLGKSVKELKCLTRAEGDGKWGRLHDAYFLAEGGDKDVEAVFASLKEEYGDPVIAKKGEAIEPISDRPLSKERLEELAALPRGKPVVAK